MQRRVGGMLLTLVTVLATVAAARAEPPAVTYDLDVTPTSGTTSTAFAAVISWHLDPSATCSAPPSAELEWGDGTVERPTPLPSRSGNLTYSHTYPVDGKYPVRGRVTCSGTERFVYRGVSVGGSAAPDFLIVCPPVTVERGSHQDVDCAAVSFNGFSSPITLSCPDPPQGITCSFEPNPATPPANGAADIVLRVSASVGTVGSNHELTIRGTSGALVRDTTIDVTVTGPEPPPPAPAIPQTLSYWCTVSLTLVSIEVLDDTELGQEEWAIATFANGLGETVRVQADVGQGVVPINKKIGSFRLPVAFFPYTVAVTAIVVEEDPLFNELGDPEVADQRVHCIGTDTFTMTATGVGIDFVFGLPVLSQFEVKLTYRWDGSGPVPVIP